MCPADECQIGQGHEQLETSSKFQITTPLPNRQREAYELFLQHAGIDVAAVEWVEDAAGKTYVYDVNTNTNYNPAAEEEANVYAHEHLAKFLGDLLSEKYGIELPQ